MNKSFRLLLIVLGTLVILGLIVFVFRGSEKSYNDTQATENQPTSNTPTSGMTKRGSPAKENITFSGYVNGKMTLGYRGPVYVCSVNVIGPIVGTIGGVEYALNLISLKANGPGTWNVSAQLSRADDEDAYLSGRVDLVINQDRRSGTINGTVTDTDRSDKIPSGAAVDISGDWECPPDYN